MQQQALQAAALAGRSFAGSADLEHAAVHGWRAEEQRSDVWRCVDAPLMPSWHVLWRRGSSQPALAAAAMSEREAFAHVGLAAS